MELLEQFGAWKLFSHLVLILLSEQAFEHSFDMLVDASQKGDML